MILYLVNHRFVQAGRPVIRPIAIPFTIGRVKRQMRRRPLPPPKSRRRIFFTAPRHRRPTPRRPAAPAPRCIEFTHWTPRIGLGTRLYRDIARRRRLHSIRICARAHGTCIRPLVLRRPDRLRPWIAVGLPRIGFRPPPGRCPGPDRSQWQREVEPVAPDGRARKPRWRRHSLGTRLISRRTNKPMPAGCTISGTRPGPRRP